MNDLKPDPSFSYETSPDLYLFTSLTAGSSHIITATSRLETILKANRIPFKAVDCATDEKARRIWGRRAGGKRLPGLVKEGMVLGDLEVVEEWNEFGEIKQVLGGAPAKQPAVATTAVPAPAAPPAPASATANEASAEDKKEEKAPPANADLPSTSIQKDLPHRTTETAPSMQQLHAQLGAEAAAIALLHSKKAPRPILDHEGKRRNSANPEISSTAGADETRNTPDTTAALTTEPADVSAETPDAAPASIPEEEPAKEDAKAVEADPSPVASTAAPETTEPAAVADSTTAPPAESSLASADPPTGIEETTDETTTKADETPASPTNAAATATDDNAPAPPLQSSLTFVEPPTRPHDTDTTNADADTKPATGTPSPPGLEPIPASSVTAIPISSMSPPDPGREPRASSSAGDLATSSSPPTHHSHRISHGSISDVEMTSPLASAAASSTAILSPASSTAGLPDAAVPLSQQGEVTKAGQVSGRHRGSSVSAASAEEIKDIEGKNAIAEEDEEEEAAEADKEKTVGEKHEAEEVKTPTTDLETVKEVAAEETASGDA